MLRGLGSREFVNIPVYEGLSARRILVHATNWSSGHNTKCYRLPLLRFSPPFSKGLVSSPATGLPLGTIVATANAIRQVEQPDIHLALQRHQAGDWGLVGAEDWAANDRALIERTRLLSAYDSATGVRFWIITEWDRSLTTVLLPEDY